MSIFSYQSRENSIYRQYMEALGVSPRHIKEIRQIPFLPVSFYKTHKVVSGEAVAEAVFYTSGTTGTDPGRHYVRSLDLYEKSIRKSFEIFYGSISGYLIIALIPVRGNIQNSSLLYMVSRLIEWSGNILSGFYHEQMGRLVSLLKTPEVKKQKKILIGVSSALLDFAESFDYPLENAIVMETGGMKGKRKELTREELHGILKKKLRVERVHSEYGMAELLTQAYSKERGQFSCPPWMKIMIRDIYDPFDFVAEGKSGAINIIDLANIDSCAFLETSDLGKISPEGFFEVLGRFDHSDIRGCNLLAE